MIEQYTLDSFQVRIGFFLIVSCDDFMEFYSSLFTFRDVGRVLLCVGTCVCYRAGLLSSLLRVSIATKRRTGLSANVSSGVPSNELAFM